jgi:Homing endonuclease associated repeat
VAPSDRTVRSDTIPRPAGCGADFFIWGDFEFCQEALAMAAKYTHKNSTMLASLKNLAIKLKRCPTRREVDAAADCPSSWTYYSRFGSLNNALKKAGVSFPRIRITRRSAMDK